MILCFTDHDGDEVAVESASIIGLSVGSIASRPEVARVTLIWAAGASQPFMVRDSFADVLKAWDAVRQTGGVGGMPGYHGWPVTPLHPSSTVTGPAAWAAKGGPI